MKGTLDTLKTATKLKISDNLTITGDVSRYVIFSTGTSMKRT